MSDDLIKRLRLELIKRPQLQSEHIPVRTVFDEDADRIEQLVKERERVIKASNDMFCVMSDSLNTAHAKLAKAVEALRKIAAGEVEFWDEDSGVNVMQWLSDEEMTDIASAALAELEKENE